MTKQEIRSPLAAIKEVESEAIKRARRIFRGSMIVGYEPVLGLEGVSKFEHWFIAESIKKISLVRKSRVFLDSGLLMLNFSANSTLIDLYSNSAEKWCNYRTVNEERKREKITNNLLRRIGEAELVILEYPERIERINKMNEAIGVFADTTVKPAVEAVFGGAGKATGLAIMTAGLTSGAIGYVVGKTIRGSGEALIRRLTRGSGG